MWGREPGDTNQPNENVQMRGMRGKTFPSLFGAFYLLGSGTHCRIAGMFGLDKKNEQVFLAVDEFFERNHLRLVPGCVQTMHCVPYSESLSCFLHPVSCISSLTQCEETLDFYTKKTSHLGFVLNCALLF